MEVPYREADNKEKLTNYLFLIALLSKLQLTVNMMMKLINNLIISLIWKF